MPSTERLAGGLFLVFGGVALALSHDLPFGTLSAPGAGMFPKLALGALLALALVLVLQRGPARAVAAPSWQDLGHALPVAALTALAIAGYVWLGFVLSVGPLVFGLLVLVERRPVLRAALVSLALTAGIDVLFTWLLAVPPEPGLLGF